jgi:hypothetical protein
MSETDLIAVGDPLPRLAAVEPANGPTSVSVTWASGSRAGRTEIIDLAPLIYTFRVLKPLRENPALFASVHLGEWGASIVWGDDPDLEIGADALEELAEETMTNIDFASFMKRHRLSLDAAAAWLGVSRRLIAYYAKERQIPRPIALACKYLDVISEAPEKQIPADAAADADIRETGSFVRVRSRRGDFAGETVLMKTREVSQPGFHGRHRDVAGSIPKDPSEGAYELTKTGAKRKLVSRGSNPSRKA